MGTIKHKTPLNPADCWPCACVKRDGSGNMTHIKLNSKKVKQCRVCGINQDGTYGRNVK